MVGDKQQRKTIMFSGASVSFASSNARRVRSVFRRRFKFFMSGSFGYGSEGGPTVQSNVISPLYWSFGFHRLHTSGFWSGFQPNTGPQWSLYAGFMSHRNWIFMRVAR